jgi:mono/diheme cytochrome c family protein
MHRQGETMRFRPALILITLIVLVSFLGYQVELSLPGRAPDLNNTYTPWSKPAPNSVGAYDVLGHVVTAEEAVQLLQTETGQKQLSPENGAVAITEELINLGRDAFYRETFGNEYFFTDVVGAIDGPINLVSMGKAIAALGGKPTTNLQIKLDQDAMVGGRTFPAGTVLNTGLDVPGGALIPLGMQTHISKGKVRVGITCAACHASVDAASGRVLEGAPNNDVDTGLLQAFGTNSAAMFRQTGVDPMTISKGDRTYINTEGQTETLPDAQALEDAVDTQLLAWSPGNFDSSPDNNNNPSQIPSSYTHEAYPYGWSGFSSIGWFHGLTTLNNNVHAVNSDPTTGADACQPLLGIDKETCLGIILQKAANPKFRLPEGTKPSEFLAKIDPTPGAPGLNEVIKMPTFPKGSPFIVDGLMASSPGLPVGTQLNGMSAFQNTLAPPPVVSSDPTSVQRGAAIFEQANCAQCHSGRYFTNHDVIAEDEIKSQPSRASALAKIPRIFAAPQTYPNSVSVPLPDNPPIVTVPTDITPQKVQELAYAINNPLGGYKVPSLVGLYVTAPYLHDGGAAAGAEAFQPDETGRYQVTNPEQLGLGGTVGQTIYPDPAASLRVLVDRQLREAVVNANRNNPDLQITNVDGSGHAYWVDEDAGFTAQDQTDLIQFLLSIDDDPAVLPKSNVIK